MNIKKLEADTFIINSLENAIELLKTNDIETLKHVRSSYNKTVENVKIDIQIILDKINNNTENTMRLIDKKIDNIKEYNKNQ